MLLVCCMCVLCLCVFFRSDSGHDHFVLPQLTGIVKLFLSSFPLSAHSSRHSSSAPVCSHRSVFFSPRYFLAVDSLLIPLLFMCHMLQSGVCNVFITYSKKTWAFIFLSDAPCIHYSNVFTKIFRMATKCK